MIQQTYMYYHVAPIHQSYAIHFCLILFENNSDINYLMSIAFKKKSQVPESVPSLQNKLNMLLGLGSSSTIPASTEAGKLTKRLILACASFWNSKQRIDKIKSLVLKDCQLSEFNDTEDFQVDELTSIQLLSLSKNHIVNLQPLSGLDTLLCLNINNNKVYDLQPLSGLTNLQQLYAANNLVNLLDGLKDLKKLQTLNLYNNKISRLEQTLIILRGMTQLQDLDIQLNPIYSVLSREKFLNLQQVVRLNGELILQEQRHYSDIMASSHLVFPSVKSRDSQALLAEAKPPLHTLQPYVGTAILSNSSSNSSHQNKKISNRKLKLKKQWVRQLDELENMFFELDDMFQEQIVRNVQLKSQYHKKVVEKLELQRKYHQEEDKQMAIQQMKKKVKAFKEKLFGDGSCKKQQLLRQLFELQIMKGVNASNHKSSKRQEISWTRKFDCDDEVFIRRNEDQSQYLTEEDEELNILLSNNGSAIEQLKRELREMAN